MVRTILLAAAIAVFTTSAASAENWHVISAARNGASILDVDSRRQGQNTFVVLRRVHPGIEQYQGTSIIATQFTLELDCQGNRFRTVLFSAIDLDGHVPAGLSSDRIRDWDTVQSGSDVAAAKDFACTGDVPATFPTSYPDFTDFEARYLQWLGDKDAQDFPG